MFYLLTPYSDCTVSSCFVLYKLMALGFISNITDSQCQCEMINDRPIGPLAVFFFFFFFFKV